MMFLITLPNCVIMIMIMIMMIMRVHGTARHRLYDIIVIYHIVSYVIIVIIIEEILYITSLLIGMYDMYSAGGGSGEQTYSSGLSRCVCMPMCNILS